MTEPCEFVEDTTTTDVGGGADVDDAGGGGAGTVVELVTVEMIPLGLVVVNVLIETERGTVV